MLKNDNIKNKDIYDDNNWQHNGINTHKIKSQMNTVQRQAQKQTLISVFYIMEYNSQ